MIRGFYSAASAMVAGLFRQELISHNISNSEVAGYKGLTTGMEDFNRVLLERVAATTTSVGATSMGVITGGAVTDFSTGALRQTDQPFDLALVGDGFFRVRTGDGQDRYTRDGRFTRDANGNLVTVEGFKLLNNAGQPLTVRQGETVIAANGGVTVNGAASGQIGVATFANPDQDLERDGANLFRALRAPAATRAVNIKQGFLELANVDAVRSMTDMMAVARAYEAAQRAVQMQDEMLGKAVNEIGQV